MDAFDNFWLVIKRFFFPALLILAGLTFIVVGAKQGAEASALVELGEDPSNTLTQTTYFMYGAVALFILGIISLFFVIQKKLPTALILGLSAVLLVGVYLFTQFNYNSIKERIVYERDVEESMELAKQGLMDIQKLQEAHKKNYSGFATSFDSLKTFASNDSISVLTKAEGDIPSRRLTSDEIKKLGFNGRKNTSRVEVITEEDAIALGLIIREYEKVPVASYLFSAEKTEKNNRLFPFELNKIDKIRTTGDSLKEYVIQTELIDSAENTIGVAIKALPPYGPQVANDIDDIFQIGSTDELKMNTNWK